MKLLLYDFTKLECYNLNLFRNDTFDKEGGYDKII